MKLRKFFTYLILFVVLVSGLFTCSERVYASGSDLTNIMQNWDGYEDADTEVISDEGASGFVLSMIEFAISAGIYVIFVLMFIQTCIDLLYIVAPLLRNLLYDYNNDPTVITDTRKGTSYQQGSSGSTVAEMCENMKKNIEANFEMFEGTVSKEEPKEKTPSLRCFISDELKTLVKKYNTVIYNGQQIDNKTSIITKYFKLRAITMILIVVVVMLLIVSGVFLGTGFNIGKAILKVLGVV